MKQCQLFLWLCIAIAGCGDDPTDPDGSATDSAANADAPGGSDAPGSSDAQGGSDAQGTSDAHGGPDVVVTPEGGALVTWNAPTSRADGSALTATSIGGYRVHYGTGSRDYSTTLDVGMTDRAAISNLQPGFTYYFAVTAYDLSDRESDFSAEVSKAL